MSAHRFGGLWTERKLAALREYLKQYQVIFTRNEAARSFQTVYVDAFAGTGERGSRQEEETESLFGYGEEARQFQTGSAQIALSPEHKFHRYVFIDSKATHVAALQNLIEVEFPELKERSEIVLEDANTWLQKWCAGQDWRLQRAVVFLDPYGMSVEWRTIEAIAKTKAIDLWVLFPFAIGANRMMPKDVLPETPWAFRLTSVFGTVDWIKRCYRKSSDTDLFGATRNSITKIAGADEILEFFLERLRLVFPHVVEKPLVLYNSNRTPMYALCFAAGNPKGGKTAVKIASYLTSKR
ncbi:MAG: three-Cys-motif partner protein TcmP [Betaproteobacteria bacterium]|nr:three-Cys-motif partner protein TcmP [Betaproteobacteria bacterium]